MYKLQPLEAALLDLLRIENNQVWGVTCDDILKHLSTVKRDKRARSRRVPVHLIWCLRKKLGRTSISTETIDGVTKYYLTPEGNALTNEGVL